VAIAQRQGGYVCYKTLEFCPQGNNAHDGKSISATVPGREGHKRTASRIGYTLRIERQFEPYLSKGRREELFRGWKKAVSRSLGWFKD